MVALAPRRCRERIGVNINALNTQEAALAAELQALDAPRRKAVIESAGSNGNLPRGDAQRTLLWVLLLLGLFVIAILCVIAGAMASDDSSAAPYFLIATAVVSGTLGLFARSPLSSS